MNITFILIILLIVLAECTAQSYTNKYHHNGNLHLYLTAVAFYGIVVYLLSKAHKYTSMGIANAIWSALSIIAVTLTGWLFFNQKICMKQCIAMIIIAISVGYLIASSPEPEP